MLTSLVCVPQTLFYTSSSFSSHTSQLMQVDCKSFFCLLFPPFYFPPSFLCTCRHCASSLSFAPFATTFFYALLHSCFPTPPAQLPSTIKPLADVFATPSPLRVLLLHLGALGLAARLITPAHALGLAVPKEGEGVEGNHGQVEVGRVVGEAAFLIPAIINHVAQSDGMEG